MLDAVLKNLIDIGWAMLIFLAAYLANVVFSLYYNIRILLQPFDKNKAINSALKVAAFVVGLTLLCVSITTLPLFAEQLGWAIPEEYTDIFADLVIVGAVLLVSLSIPFFLICEHMFTVLDKRSPAKLSEVTNILKWSKIRLIK